MKRLIAILLALVILPLSGFAASVRDIRYMETEHESGVSALMDVVLSAAMLKDIRDLPEGTKPPEGLVEAVFAVYTFFETGALSAELNTDDAAALYRAFFGEGAYTLPETGDCPCVRIEDGVMKMDLEELNETPLVGLWIYETRDLDGSRVWLKGDMFTARGHAFASAWEIPDDELTWYCSAEACIERDEGALFGWKIVSCSLGEIYLDGSVPGWTDLTDEEAGYSLLVPSILTVSAGGPEKRTRSTADGEITLTVEPLPPMDEAAADAYFEGEANLRKDSVETGLRYYAVEGPRAARVLIAGADMKQAYLITLTYPEGRQDEMALYLEFIRNSFNEAGNTNG